MQQHALFMTVEGIEGAGKTTVIQFIEEHLKKHHVDLILSREPGGSEIAEAIRDVLLSHYDEKMENDTELLLFFAGRAQHLAHVVKPALSEGKVVLSDRFTDASFAYQGAGRGIPEKRIEVLENWVQGDLRPDITLLLDLPVDVGMSRAKNRGDLDRIEVEEMQFFERVRQCYLDRAQRYANRYRVVDVSVPLDAVKASLLKIIETDLLPKIYEHK